MAAKPGHLGSCRYNGHGEEDGAMARLEVQKYQWGFLGYTWTAEEAEEAEEAKDWSPN